MLDLALYWLFSCSLLLLRARSLHYWIQHKILVLCHALHFVAFIVYFFSFYFFSSMVNDLYSLKPRQDTVFLNLHNEAGSRIELPHCHPYLRKVMCCNQCFYVRLYYWICHGDILKCCSATEWFKGDVKMFLNMQISLIIKGFL